MPPNSPRFDGAGVQEDDDYSAKCQACSVQLGPAPHALKRLKAVDLSWQTAAAIHLKINSSSRSRAG